LITVVFARRKVRDAEETRVEEKEKEFSALSAGAPDGYIESTCCCVPARFLGYGNKNLFPLFWFIQRYLIMY
jgi:hypothetical protein